MSLSRETLGINCTELTQLSDYARVMSDIAKFGFKHVRVEIPWALVEPTKGRYVLDAVARITKQANALGLVLLPILGVHMPTWAYTAQDFGNFAKRVHAVMGASTYEVMNEPNLHTFNAWGGAAAIVPLVNAAKSNLPGVKIAYAGLAACVTYSGVTITKLWGFIPWPVQFRNLSPEDHLAEALKLGASFDITNYHPYSLSPGFTDEPPTPKQGMIARTSVLRKLGGTRPMWLTEWGFDVRKLGEQVVADRIAAQLELTDPQCERQYLFCWRDYAAHNGNFGVVTAANVERPKIARVVRAVL